MALSIKQFQRSSLEKKIFNLRYDINFNKNYAIVQKEVMEQKQFKKISRLESKKDRILHDLEVRTLTENDYVNIFAKTKIDKTINSFNWKKLAIETCFKRKIAKNRKTEEDLVVELEKLEQLKINKINLINEKTKNDYQKLVLVENKVYEDKKNEFKLEIENFKKSLKEIDQEKIVMIDKKVSEKAVVLEKKLEQLMDRMNELIQHDTTITLDDNVLISIRNLTMQFGGLKAVNDLSFDVKEGEIFGLIGPNGAGKTTVFNCITQFYKPTEGSIVYKNKSNDILLLNSQKVHNVIKHGIVRTFQNVELIWELNILDNLLVGAHSVYRSNFFDHSLQTNRYRKEQAVLKARALEVLKSLDLLPYQFAYPIGLPYGTLKRIELARTLMTNPKMIILDEPAAGLNEVETKQLSEIIKQIQKNFKTTIFLVEHDMGLVMSVCDRICAISFGKMLAVGTPAEIQENQLVQEAYLGGE